MTFMTRVYKFEESSSSPTSSSADFLQKKQQHAMAMRNFKKLLKPLIRLISKKRRQVMKKTLAEIQEQNANNSSLEDMRRDPVAQEANDDNLANEALEQRLYQEMRHCADGAAVIVRQGEKQHLMPVQREQNFIPVHFARTTNGTFFWTSVDATAATLCRQQEMMLLHSQLDRWGQA